MYKQSVFYKRFLPIAFQDDFHDTSNMQLNNFYCTGFFGYSTKEVYIPILPLWTWLNCEERLTNLTKKQDSIGKVPLRSGRYLRFSRQRIINTAETFSYQIGRKGNCERKRYKKSVISTNENCGTSKFTQKRRGRPKQYRVRSLQNELRLNWYKLRKPILRKFNNLKMIITSRSRSCSLMT